MRKIVFRFLFSIFYISGLVSLFSYFVTFGFSNMLNFRPNYFLFSSIFLLLFGFFGEVWNERSLRLTFRYLGLLTLIPGIIGILILFFGDNIIYGILTKVNNSIVNDVMRSYLENNVPKTYGLVSLYVFIGALFFYFSRKILK